MKYARKNRSIYIEEAEKLAEEIEDLMLMKSLTTGAELTVRIVDRTWLGHVAVVVDLRGEDSFDVEVSSEGYKFNAFSGSTANKLINLLNRTVIKFKDKESVLRLIRRYVL